MSPRKSRKRKAEDTNPKSVSVTLTDQLAITHDQLYDSIQSTTDKTEQSNGLDKFKLLVRKLEFIQNHRELLDEEHSWSIFKQFKITKHEFLHPRMQNLFLQLSSDITLEIREWRWDTKDEFEVRILINLLHRKSVTDFVRIFECNFNFALLKHVDHECWHKVIQPIIQPMGTSTLLRILFVLISSYDCLGRLNHAYSVDDPQNKRFIFFHDYGDKRSEEITNVLLYNSLLPNVLITIICQYEKRPLSLEMSSIL
jgi:hypothetical protein